MAYLNKCFLIGNLTRDPELRVTPKGTSIASFGLAINRQSKNADGSHADDVTFVDIEAWGKQAELVAKYLAKGSPCMVEGRLRLDSWEDKNTQQKRSRLKVVLENVQFLGARSNGTPAEVREGEQAPPDQATTAPAPAANPHLDDDVPF